MSTHARRRLRAIAYRSLRLAHRHYISLVSACILGGAAYLALTSGGFDSPSASGPESTLAAAAPAPAEAVAIPPRASIRTTSRPRGQAIVYVVMTEAEGTAVLATHNRLTWDTVTGDVPPNLPDIHYVVAGTPEEQSEAIQTLNSYIEVAALLRVDLRIIDIRPGRGVTAKVASP